SLDFAQLLLTFQVDVASSALTRRSCASQDHADPMEDIIEEDLDCGTANSLEALYVGLYRDLGKFATADGIVVISTSAHPAAYIAARELDRECHVLSDRPSRHSVERGKRIAAGMWRGAYLTKHADPAAGQGKRTALDDVQIEPPAADTWGGVDFVPTDLAAKAPALLASELDSCKLEITSLQ
ncbi:unnamed protein product, partial [Effrenium voratum]